LPIALGPCFADYQAVEELNIRPLNWRDLLTDEPFTRKDIIHLQDPLNLTSKNLSAFDHVRRDLRLESDEELAAQRVGKDGFCFSKTKANLTPGLSVMRSLQHSTGSAAQFLPLVRALCRRPLQDRALPHQATPLALCDGGLWAS
jgi:hypothetical protein